MPRQRRLDLAGVPQHVIQRGNNRQPCFLREQDCRCYVSQIDDAARAHGCRIHTYVLMTNRVHLLLTPLGGTLQVLSVDSERYLLTCYRYIELNPLRAAMVVAPGDYAWSSFRANAQGRADRIVHTHDEYARLGTTVDERCTAYRA